MSLDELEPSFGIKPPKHLNSGLSVVRRKSIDFDTVDRWLRCPRLCADRWVTTEQTLHALCSMVGEVRGCNPPDGGASLNQDCEWKFLGKIPHTAKVIRYYILGLVDAILC